MAEIMDHRFKIIFTRTHLTLTHNWAGCTCTVCWKKYNKTAAESLGNAWTMSICTMALEQWLKRKPNEEKKNLFHTIALAAYFKLQLKQIEPHRMPECWYTLKCRERKKEEKTLKLFHFFPLFSMENCKNRLKYVDTHYNDFISAPAIAAKFY